MADQRLDVLLLEPPKAAVVDGPASAFTVHRLPGTMRNHRGQLGDRPRGCRTDGAMVEAAGIVRRGRLSHGPPALPKAQQSTSNWVG
jgi:hypothetical protein